MCVPITQKGGPSKVADLHSEKQPSFKPRQGWVLWETKEAQCGGPMQSPKNSACVKEPAGEEKLEPTEEDYPGMKAVIPIAREGARSFQGPTLQGARIKKCPDHHADFQRSSHLVPNSFQSSVFPCPHHSKSVGCH